MKSVILNNKDVNIAFPQYHCSGIYLLLLRFYFVFFPMYPLISKFIGTSIWKDGLYIFFSLISLNVFIKNKFFIAYFLAIFVIILLQFAQGYDYMEYLTWFLMGPPLFLYFRYISKKNYTQDLYILMFIMIVGFLFVFGYEIPSQDSMFFEVEKPRGNGSFFLRDGLTRARFGFVSPMAFSQYSWFIALVVFINKSLNRIVRIIFAVLMLISIFYCNTRAGVLLSILTFGVFFYAKFNLYKIKFNNFLLIALIIFAVITKSIISGQTANHNNETLSDQLRILLLLDGFNKAKEHFVLGLSGEFYSARSEKWYDFENSWLSLVVCFGLIGVFLIILLVKKMVFSVSDKYLILLIIPWLAYSSIFPILQEPTAVFITWFIVAAIMNINKWNYLNSLDLKDGN